MKIKLFITLFFFILLFHAVSGQNRMADIKATQTLEYYTDANSPYLVPYIENVLKELRLTHVASTPLLFNEVNSLSLLISGQKIAENFYNIKNIYSNQAGNLNQDKIEKKLNELILTQLNKKDYFLVITINQLNSLVEYQFTLLKINKNSEENKSILDFSNYRSSSCFIDPTASDYQEKLYYGIKQIFPEANEKPKVFFLTNNQFTDSSTITIAANDSLKIEGIYEDNDSPKEKITYEWNISGKQLPNFNPGSRSQQIVFSDIGNYVMSLKVSDGIDYTVKLVNINVIDPLRINKISDHNGNVFRDNDYIPFYTFYKYSPKKNERNTMCLFLENEHNPKFEFKVVGDKDLIKFDKSNDTNKRINEKVNEFVISPANINSKEYLLELIIKDDGNQIIKKIIKMQIRTPSKLSIFYNYSNLAAYLPSVSGKSNFYSNKFGVSYRFKKFISVSPSL
jgi:hypothetical protein